MYCCIFSIYIASSRLLNSELCHHLHLRLAWLTAAVCSSWQVFSFSCTSCCSAVALCSAVCILSLHSPACRRDTVRARQAVCRSCWTALSCSCELLKSLCSWKSCSTEHHCMDRGFSDLNGEFNFLAGAQRGLDLFFLGKVVLSHQL